MSDTHRSLRHAGFLLPGGLFLAACGNGTVDGGPTADFAAYQAQTAALVAAWAGAAVTDPATLPISGSASYTGIMQLTAETSSGELAMAGSMNLFTDFTTDALSGSADKFVDENANVLAGTLAITGGVLDRGADTSVEFTYTANLDGTLTGGGDNFAISGDISGDFLGPDFLGSSGIVAGTAISGFGSGYIFGDFMLAQ